MTERFLRVKQVAEIMQISPQTVRRRFEQRGVAVMGERHSTRSKRRYRVLLISERELNAWIAERRG